MAGRGGAKERRRQERVVGRGLTSKPALCGGKMAGWAAGLEIADWDFKLGLRGTGIGGTIRGVAGG